MTEFKVSKTSWHYRFYRWMEYMRTVSDWISHTDNKEYHYRYFDNTVSYHAKNFCQYWRQVLVFPAIRFGCSLAMDFIIIGSIIGTIYCIMSNPMTVAFTILSVIIAGVVVFAILVIIALMAKAGERIIESDSSFVHTAYDAYKNKYCPVVTYNKDEE